MADSQPTSIKKPLNKSRSQPRHHNGARFGVEGGQMPNHKALRLQKAKFLLLQQRMDDDVDDKCTDMGMGITSAAGGGRSTCSNAKDSQGSSSHVTKSGITTGSNPQNPTAVSSQHFPCPSPSVIKYSKVRFVLSL
mmetsp:Transcript_31157/g.96927  ORF Transcript_31157/g.96927 Transcript_31157/m.96927 type:complete len:136 (+) Transcript_31157:60-467(+)